MLLYIYKVLFLELTIIIELLGKIYLSPLLFSSQPLEQFH